MNKFKKQVLNYVVSQERIRRMEAEECPVCESEDLEISEMTDLDQRSVVCNKCKSEFTINYDVSIRNMVQES